MKLKMYPSIGGFFKDNLQFLEREEAANNLIIGIPMSMEKYPFDDKKLKLLNVFDKGSVVISIAQTPPRNLLVYCDKRGVKYFNELIDFLIHNNFKVNGVVGLYHEMVEFSDHWSEITGQRWQFNFKQKAYQLKKLVDVRISPGTFRKAKKDDLPILSEWMKAFVQEALPTEQMENAEEIIKSIIKNEASFVWENNGELVSMACSSRPTRNCVTVNYVYTPKKFRAKGYGSSVTHQLSKYLLTKHKTCALFTDLDNPTSNSIYQKIGYREVARWCTIDFV